MITRRALLGAAGAVVAAGKKRNRRKWPVGWQQNLFPLVIVTAGPGFQGFFAYSPAPGPGNLVASIASHGGVDPYGNTYVAGISSYLSNLIANLTGGGFELFVAGETGSASIDQNLDGAGHFAMQIASPQQGTAAVILLSPSQWGTKGAAQVVVAATNGNPAPNTAALLEVQGDLQAGDGLSTGQGLAIQTLVNGSTINTAGKTMQPVTAAASVTGIILQAGTFDGQTIELPSDAGAGITITFAAAATSHVKTGVGTVIQPGSCLVLKWVASTSLWYPVQ